MKMVPESKAEKENKNRFWDKLEEIFNSLSMVIAAATVIAFTIMWKAPGTLLAFGVIGHMIQISFIGECGCCGPSSWTKKSVGNTAIANICFLMIILVNDGVLLQPGSIVFTALFSAGIAIRCWNAFLLWMSFRSCC
ncbi:MAG: hypothetical protein IKM88_09065 [Lachnospiraceae bacterium]|nr:hypothetical protein [Lachnospiraceae bacterium]